MCGVRPKTSQHLTMITGPPKIMMAIDNEIWPCIWMSRLIAMRICWQPGHIWLELISSSCRRAHFPWCLATWTPTAWFFLPTLMRHWTTGWMEEMNREQVPHCIESILAIYFQNMFYHLVCQHGDHGGQLIDSLSDLVTNTSWIVLKTDHQIQVCETLFLVQIISSQAKQTWKCNMHHFEMERDEKLPKARTHTPLQRLEVSFDGWGLSLMLSLRLQEGLWRLHLPCQEEYCQSPGCFTCLSTKNSRWVAGGWPQLCHSCISKGWHEDFNNICISAANVKRCWCKGCTWVTLRYFKYVDNRYEKTYEEIFSATATELGYTWHAHGRQVLHPMRSLTGARLLWWSFRRKRKRNDVNWRQEIHTCKVTRQWRIDQLKEILHIQIHWTCLIFHLPNCQVTVVYQRVCCSCFK